MNKAKVFGLYLGCEVVMHPEKGIGVLGHVQCLDDDYSQVGATIDGRYFDRHIDDFKLILTPLSEITDEDAIEVARIVLEKDGNWNPDGIERWDWRLNLLIKTEPDITDRETTVKMFVIIDFESDVPVQWHWEYIKGNGSGSERRECPNVVHAIDYLRSKGYHLPFMGQDLYEAGIAITPTTSNLK